MVRAKPVAGGAVHLGNLVLQGAGAGADHNLAAGKDRRHQVRDGLAGPVPASANKRSSMSIRLGYALGHGELARARLKARQLLGQ